MAQIDAFLEEILRRKGSDLHFIAGETPAARRTTSTRDSPGLTPFG